MTRRDKLAGWQHLAEFVIACVGLGGWLLWVTHKQSYAECNCALAEVKRKL